jgi:hypothetical protein
LGGFWPNLAATLSYSHIHICSLNFTSAFKISARHIFDNSMASQYTFRDNITRYNYKVVDKAGVGGQHATMPVDPLLTANADTNTGPNTSFGVGIDSIDNSIDTSAVALSVVTTTAAETANTSPVLNDIYDNSEEDLLATLASSLNPLESVSQVPRVPQLQAKPSIRSWVFDHFRTILLDTYYISKRTRKRTQNRLHKCKQC